VNSGRAERARVDVAGGMDAQIVVTLVTCGIGSIWGLIDAIMILVDKVPDAEGRTLRE
jgi:hypothetical protein